MNKNIMKKWVKALKSGNFKQGKGTLKHYDTNAQARHCCLGVLCELYNDQMKKDKKKTLSEKTLHNDSFYHGVVEFNRSRDYLPKKVVDWADVNDNFGWFYDFLSRLKYLTGCMRFNNYVCPKIAGKIVMHHATCAFNSQEKMEQMNLVRSQIGLDLINWSVHTGVC